MAPWTPDEVENINRWQRKEAVHPLTCPDHSTTPLTVSQSAVYCPYCEYRQNWVPTALTLLYPPDAEEWPEGSGPAGF